MIYLQHRTVISLLTFMFLTVAIVMVLTLPAHAAGTVTSSFMQKQTITESCSIGEYSQTCGAEVSIVQLQASAPPTDKITFTANVSGTCKLLEGTKGGLLGTSVSRQITINGGQYGTYGFVEVYSPDTSTYEGTRSCIVSFSKTSSNDADFNNLSIASKTVTVIDDETAPAPSPTTSPTPQPTNTAPSTQSTPSADDPIKPEVPQTKLTDPEGNELKPQEGEEKITFQDKEPIVLSGTTVPNGEVKLYIFSDPQEATVTADETGAWTYTIENIEPGDHRVEVEVTDPETGETSERKEVLAFAVAQADESSDEEEALLADLVTKENSDSSILILLIVSIVVLAGAGGGAFWWIRRRKQQPKTPQTDEPKVEPATTNSPEAKNDDENTEEPN